MEHADAILILGHRLEKDGKPSDDQIRRVNCAVEHWKQINEPLIMPCGGLTPGQTQTEAEVMRDLLIARGVPAEKIRLEDRSRITIENVRNAVALLGEGKRVALVTSDYHVRRSVLTAMRAGFRAKGYAAVLEHDESWQHKKNQELAYTVDLLMGWQDEGKSRPAWTYKLFDFVFGKKDT